VLGSECAGCLNSEDELVVAFVKAYGSSDSLLNRIQVAFVAEIASIKVFNVDGLAHLVERVNMARARGYYALLLLYRHLVELVVIKINNGLLTHDASRHR